MKRKNKTKLPILLLILIATGMIQGCAIISISQEAWSGVLNTVYPYEGYSLSRNLLWSEDNERIYFVVWKGSLNRQVDYGATGFFDPVYTFFLGMAKIAPYAGYKDVWKLRKLEINRGKIKTLSNWIDEDRSWDLFWVNDQEIYAGTRMINIRKLKIKKVTDTPQANKIPSTLSDYGYKISLENKKNLLIYGKEKVIGKITLPVFEEIKADRIFMSFDNKKIAFTLYDYKKNTSYICIANIDGSDLKLFRVL
jgi:hypothetical protein